MMGSVEKLISFETGLQYSVATGKSFICFVEENSAFSDDNCTSLEAAVEHIYKENQDVKVEILNILKLCDGADRSESDSTSSTNAGKLVKISIVPRINKLTQQEEVQLVKKIRRYSEHAPKSQYAKQDCRSSAMIPTVRQAPKHIFIGVLKYQKAHTEENSGEDSATAKGSPKMQDWLRKSFWLASTTPVGGNSPIAAMGPYDRVNIHPRLRRYIYDIMVHLRMHALSLKTKGGGIHHHSLDDITQLSQLISITSSRASTTLMDHVTSDERRWFVTPDYVKIACMYYFPLQLQIIENSSMDVSVSYGSKPRLVDDLLQKLQAVQQLADTDNPLFLQALVVRDVLSKVIPAI